MLAALAALACVACSGGAPAENPSRAGALNESAQAAASAAQGARSSSPQPEAERPAGAKVYRGTLSGRGVELRLAREGGRLTGSYSYDGIGQELRLEGQDVSGGRFTLAEFDPAGKQTGRFACDEARRGEWGQEISCNWTKPGGGGEVFVALFEQHADFKSGRLRVAPKVTENRKFGARASYPQLVALGGAQLPASAASFNRVVEKRVNEAVASFTRDAEPGRDNLYFRIDYNVLLGTDELVSVELSEDAYSGGAHPSFYYRALTYDLRAGRELQLAEMFKPGGGHERAIREHAFRQINERVRGADGGAAREGGDPPVVEEMFGDVSAWGITPRGLMIYYELPHAVAAFQRTFVPFVALDAHLRPDGPAAQIKR